jgi:hypothetical protein
MDDYFERIERQLVARVEAASQRTGVRSATRRMRLLIGRASLGAAAATIAALAALALAGTFTVLLATHRTNRTVVSFGGVVPSQGAGSVPAGLQASFAALRRARTAADVLPSDVLRGLAAGQQGVGLDPRQSRLTLSTQAMNIWLVPGERQICIVVRNNQSTSGGMGCTTPAAARQIGRMSDSSWNFGGGLQWIDSQTVTTSDT